jgi:hypothetical protein
MLVKNVTIKGVQWPLVLGMHVTEMISKQAGNDGFTGLKLYAALMFYGHESHCLIEGIENKLTLKDCYLHVETTTSDGNEQLGNELSDILLSFMNSKPVRDMKEAAEEIQKKIQAGMKSDPTPSE